MTTTWNQNDKSPDVALSNGNLTVTASASQTLLRSVRSTTAKSTGRSFFTVRVDASKPLNEAKPSPGGYEEIGVMTQEQALQGVGRDTMPDGVGYNSNGSVYRIYENPNHAILTISPYAVGATIGVLLDLNANIVQFYKDGSTAGPAISITPGIYFAAVGVSSAAAVIVDEVVWEPAWQSTVTGDFNPTAPLGIPTWEQTPSVLLGEEPPVGLGPGGTGGIAGGVSWAADLPWITVSNNADWNESFNVFNGAVPANLTDVTFRMQMRSLGGNIAFIDAGALPGEMVINGNPTFGVMTVRVPAERLRGIPPGVYIRDIIMLRGGERIYAGRGRSPSSLGSPACTTLAHPPA